MGVGIALLRLAVGGPTGVADAALAGGTLGLVTGREVDQFALCLQAAEGAGRIHRGNPGGVVAAVFQLAQALQQQRRRFPRTDQRNDAAHNRLEPTKKPGRAGLELMGKRSNGLCKPWAQ